MLGILLTTLIFIGALMGLSKLLDIQEVRTNWSKYRCRPDIMLTAGLYGFDTADNLAYCLKNGFDQRASSAISPFYSYMGSFVSTLMALLASVNSLRMTFATIVGSVTQVFSEFSARIKAVLYRIQSSSIRIKFLMSRIFATMYSIIFMGMSGIKATQNFGNTELFKFLNFICFDPSTPVRIEGKGEISIRDVCMGDVFEGTNDKVTGLFKFLGDGQAMVNIRGCTVSTNHYVMHNKRWIQAKDHPDAKDAGLWEGGVEKPLICFNTSTHEFPIGDLIFRDYDESEMGDKETMQNVLNVLNGKSDTSQCPEYIMCCHPDTIIVNKDRIDIPASLIKLGDDLTHGKVLGVIKRECTSYCLVGEEKFAVGTAVWHGNKWKRASDISPIYSCKPTSYISLIVNPSACIETKGGNVFRDYFEIHEPFVEDAYTKALHEISVCVP